MVGRSEDEEGELTDDEDNTTSVLENGSPAKTAQTSLGNYDMFSSDPLVPETPEEDEFQLQLQAYAIALEELTSGCHLCKKIGHLSTECTLNATSVGESADGSNGLFNGRHYGAGRPIEGTPLEDNGKWKLRVVGLGNDGTVKSNDLKKAFEEKGATVVDCFVPEGKHFGFISFSSQEDAEKYGSMMNGSKPFPEGRYLRIDWALPRSNGAGGGTRTCHKCKQPGHIAPNCPGVISDGSEGATFGITTESAGKEGASGIDWGDTGTTPAGADWATSTSAPTSAPSSDTRRERGGQGGKPITGTPNEDRGKWKLRVLGFGDDGSVGSDDLKAAFEEKGATVADAFVPEGKNFGFISFSTQEDAEKYGTMMNGSKPFPNGRFLKIDWALPKAGGGGGGGPRTCHKCQQTGHMASNCPGVSNAAASTESTTDTWGGASTETPATDSAAGSGWGDVTTATTDSATGGGGWADTTSSAGSDWASSGTISTPVVNDAGRDRGGQGGKPITGTPLEDRGKWKLRVLGLGDDGSVKSDDLKAAFEAKGATVPDAYVPEGKHFGFISFSTQEDAEKYGAMQNGSKPFPNGRFLNIQWALPRGGTAGGSGGGGRNCFKCNQPGHMSRECPGATASTTSIDTPAVPDTWGSSAADATATDTSSGGGGGWGDAAATSKVKSPEASGGGWGDTSEVKSATVVASGLDSWGWSSDENKTTAEISGGGAGWGSDTVPVQTAMPDFSQSRGGKTVTGTPYEDRGKWKLRVMGLGDDGSVKADDLKSVFEAKGATVADVYVPEGKPFGFISFNSQEDAEKYGAMLIGSKPFPNGRFLNVQWSLPRGGAAGGGGGGRNCFKCNQPGHMASNCPGAATTPLSNDSTATSDSWGTPSSQSSGSEAAAGGGGWGDSAATTTEPITSSGGWGDTTTTSTSEPSASSGGDWGSSATTDASSNVSTPVRSNNGGDGQGGKPIGGTSCEDSGKWKLRAFGLGNDGSVKADVLKAAFEAKGATVVDAYVPEGKPFGFVSFSSQEEAEKYGTMMNGIKPFPNGRYLQIDWALAKAGGGGARTCHKCQQPGHMANNCLGVNASSSSTEPAITDTWGSASIEPAATTDTVGGGWGATGTSSSDGDGAAAGGGWGDVSAATSEATNSGGGWGETANSVPTPVANNSGHDRVGQGGKPITGTPCEDRGKWKLRVVGLGDDGSIKSGDLKAVFEAKGATVPDAYVPEGKHFGFISFSTQEDAEKYGAMLNGSKPFPNGRFLNIQWALPKGGTPGGGGRNCFKCNQPGHMASNCPGVSASTPSTDSTGTSDSWGTPSSQSSGQEAATGGGWGDTPASTSVPVASTGGWGDVSSGGGDWGSGAATDTSSNVSTPVRSTNGGDGQGGKPVGGTPCEDRGKWKLRVFGLGHDSSVKADDLKAAFEAKGATVVDAYVPEGKPFGFVSFGSQEDGEKYGTMMNGVKPFPGGRYLQIDWALAKSGGGSGGGGGPRTCHKCQQTGHMANNCPGVSSATAASESTTDSWGGASTETPVTDSAAGGGWGEVTTATTESANSCGGWGDTASSAGSDWATSTSAPSPATNNAGRDRGGDGGKPITGTPFEDRGKWKLRVVGFGDDGSVTTDDLKAAFEAKGATVADAFVPEGKYFGFISFSTQEDAEKYGAMMNGSKTFPNGRFLNIQWALPKGGTAGGSGGGGRNCFKCNQPGHMSRECPGATASTTSIDTPAVPDTWGSSAADATATDTSSGGGGGWGDAAATSKVKSPEASGGGWGDTSEVKSATVVASGLDSWGWSSDENKTTAEISGGGAGWGSDTVPVQTAMPDFSQSRGGGGKTVAGTPYEDRGKWKLRVMGLGDDGSVKSEDLKSVFEAKGATVADVYVPEGKPFGFISFNSQEDAEKYGAILIGSKPFPNGRPLRIDWSLPKGGAAGGGGRNCFKCNQPGHMASNCPGAATTPLSNDSTATSDSWGTPSSQSSGSEAAAGGGGWGDSAATTTEPITSSGGWGDTTTTSTSEPSASSGGDWGSSATTDASSNVSTPVRPNNGGGGQGGKPITGTPCEDRGKWKLRVLGLGDDGSIKADDLKGAFEAKGATVADAYVPEGKYFGFVSFSTQEDAEKYGAMMNGSKPFPNGRFLRIDWSLAKVGGAGGGARTCHKCQQTGHMANNCPGVSGASASTDSTTDSWGGASTGTSATDSAAGGGWGDGATTVSDTGSGGWGDASAATNDTSGGGSDWGGSSTSAVPASTNAGRPNFTGQSGKPLGGTPTEERGKWKLKIVGLGDDGSVKSEDLKAAFEAKGASVADAYVPEGKHFGFVSFTTQEDGEKYGTMMNGSKPFPNGRFLRIEWAQPRNAAGGPGGSGGGSRNANPYPPPTNQVSNPQSDAWGASAGDSASTATTDGGGWGDAASASTTTESSSGGGWGDSGTKTTPDGVFKIPQDPPGRPTLDPKQAYVEYQKSLAQRLADEELTKTKREAEEARASMEEAQAERERYYEMAQRQRREAQKPVRPPPRRKSEMMGGVSSQSLSVDWIRQAVDRNTNSLLKELNNLETIPRQELADTPLSADLRAKLREDTDNLYPAQRASHRSPTKRELLEDGPSPKRAKKRATPSSQKKNVAPHELFGLPATEPETETAVEPATPPPTLVTSPGDILGRTRLSTRKLQAVDTPSSQPSTSQNGESRKKKKKVSFSAEEQIIPFEAPVQDEVEAPAQEPEVPPPTPGRKKNPGLLKFLFSGGPSTSPTGSAKKKAKR